jgi:hypothetical protein
VNDRPTWQPYRPKPEEYDTRDFIELFTYAAGEWTTPYKFFRWAAISLIAACVEDRVWLPFAEHIDTYPNVWVFLIGPAGTGKDHAIRLALSLLRPEDPLWVLDGKATISGLYDFMVARQKASGRDSAPTFLVSSDAATLLPCGPEAKDFTSRVVDLYDRHNRVLTDITRTGGEKRIVRPMLNWLLGTTPSWFPLAIDPQVFNSGFARRTFFIFGEPILDNLRLEAPVQRFDSPAIFAALRRRVERLQSIEGMFTLTKRAKVFYTAWRDQNLEQLRYSQLSEVERDVIINMRLAVSKLAIIFALAEYTDGLLLVRGRHMEKAIACADELIVGVRQVADYAYQTQDTMLLERVAETIRRAGALKMSALLKTMTKRGVSSALRLKECVDTLVQQGDVKLETRKLGVGRPATWVVWRSRKIPLGG